MEKNLITYPFTAIVGQEEMKKALLLNLINPSIGGVLIKGEKGTAKSTAVRSLVDVTPKRKEVIGCSFSCNPDDTSYLCEACKETSYEVIEKTMRVINLPISATEDRVVGTLDLEHAIKFGEKKFEPGILAEANNNILYVDEVNLLEDHIVDLLLDAAAMGVNVIEREGVSFHHPSKFVLVGTMNPEEGDLRPQLTDRFGLVVDVRGETDPEKRADVINRRLLFEKDQQAFYETFQNDQERLRQNIANAISILPEVTYDQSVPLVIADIAIKMGVDGHRADITMLKTALTHAACQGRKEVQAEDLEVAASLVLPHRMRKKPFEENQLDLETVHEMIRGAY